MPGCSEVRRIMVLFELGGNGEGLKNRAFACIFL